MGRKPTAARQAKWAGLPTEVVAVVAAGVTTTPLAARGGCPSWAAPEVTEAGTRRKVVMCPARMAPHRAAAAVEAVWVQRLPSV